MTSSSHTRTGLAIREHIESIPVFPTEKAGPIPTACNPAGCYPYETAIKTASKSELRDFQMVTLENQFIVATLCPDLGGRLVSLKRKNHDGSVTESLFDSGCVRPARILPRGEFIGGGIELSFPISHSPVLLEKVLYRCITEDNRIAVQFGERELRFGMQWLGEYSLGENDDYLTQRALFHNPGTKAHPWMSWSNAGVPCAPDTEFQFPAGPVLRHSSKLDVIDWETEGPCTQSEISEMTGYFWQDPDVNAFGVYTPSLNSGLYHIADRDQMPGIKLWSDGVGRDEIWVNQYTTDNRQCLEIQAGPLADQSIKAHLSPGESHAQIEFWIPTSKRLNIRELDLPDARHLPELRIDDLFSWAREESLEIFKLLLAAYRNQEPERIPNAPGEESNLWAPSGIDELGDAMDWASDVSGSSAWRFQYGSWLAGRNEVDAALKQLSLSKDPRAYALAAWLQHFVNKSPQSALALIESIPDGSLKSKQQIILLHLEVFRACDEDTVEERQKLLASLSDSQDDQVIEEKAALLIDRGQAREAYDLLINHSFQPVHQRYRRTELLQLAVTALGLSAKAALPELVGEDTLAEFGAYQEYTS